MTDSNRELLYPPGTPKPLDLRPHHELDDVGKTANRTLLDRRSPSFAHVAGPTHGALKGTTA